MAKTLDLFSVLRTDNIACRIAEKFVTWEDSRQNKVNEWREVQEYIFATDTTKTTNSKLPWSNKTTIPKLCQIRDNLHANYMTSMFPKQRWMVWEGASPADEDSDKKEAIEAYMYYACNRDSYYNMMSQLVYDYIDYGNCFAMPTWIDQTILLEDREQVGYVGPGVTRISPLDIVFDPTTSDFASTPKIVRSIVTMGEVKQILEAQTASVEDREMADEVYEYLRGIRQYVAGQANTAQVKDRIYQISGFDNYQSYLDSGYVEILTFYGDYYDDENDKLHKNVIIKIADRHKIVFNGPNPSVFGTAPIFHAGWRLRPDNLWAMGPLDNLVGMQYRIDHLENMKADCFDLIAYPPLKIKGYVEEFEWAPMERIYVGDDGDVEMLSPEVLVLQADNQIAILEMKMEEMAGSPKEAMGFRTPGEKTKYEVQSLENAASRVFQNKIQYFERHVTENLLNGMLELAKRNAAPATIRVFDDELKFADFMDLSNAELTGNGRIKPYAARHFAEKANMIQNLTQFMGSPAYAAVAPHFSSKRLAKVFENLLEIEAYKVVMPNVAVAEQAETQQMANAAQEQTVMAAQTPSNLAPGDYSPGIDQQVLAENSNEQT